MPRRKSFEKTRDYRDTAKLYLQGYAQWEIAEIISESRPYTISRGQISQDLDKIREIWVNSAVKDFNQARAQELARLDMLEKEYWEAWQRSRLDYTEEIAEQKKGQNPTKEGTPLVFDSTKLKKIKQTRDGNFKFLEGVQWCINKRCQIMGLDAPHKVDISWRKQAEAVGVDPEEVKQQLVDQFVSAAIKGLKSGEDK